MGKIRKLVFVTALTQSKETGLFGIMATMSGFVKAKDAVEFAEELAELVKENADELGLGVINSEIAIPEH